jgi:hypothetical protein
MLVAVAVVNARQHPLRVFPTQRLVARLAATNRPVAQQRAWSSAERALGAQRAADAVDNTAASWPLNNFFFHIGIFS